MIWCSVSWLRENMKTLSRSSELAKVFVYALNQWLLLMYYADDRWAGDRCCTA